MRSVSTNVTCEISSDSRFETYTAGDHQEEGLGGWLWELGAGSGDLPHGSVELVELV